MKPFPGHTILALSAAARHEHAAGHADLPDVTADLLAAGRLLRESAGQVPECITSTQAHNVQQAERGWA